MGIEFFLYDDKNRRVLALGKFYGFRDFFDDHKPFTVEQFEAEFHDRPWFPYAAAIVTFCTDADWCVHMSNDSESDEDLDTDYRWFHLVDGNKIEPEPELSPPPLITPATSIDAEALANEHRELLRRLKD